MSGVIIDGIQWEHCNVCGMFVELTKLGYLKDEEFDEIAPYGMDICDPCSDIWLEIGVDGLKHMLAAVHEAREYGKMRAEIKEKITINPL